MSITSLFKYNSLVSIPLFLSIAFLLIRLVPNFSHSRQTISRTIEHIGDLRLRIIFRLNFLLKSVLDFGFWFYLVSNGRMNWNSIESLFLFIAICMFALLAYFVDGIYHLIHLFLIYGLMVLWCIVEIILAHKIGNNEFVWSTYVMTIAPSVVAFLYLYWKKTNVYVQLICTAFTYVWLLWYVVGFL